MRSVLSRSRPGDRGDSAVLRAAGVGALSVSATAMAQHAPYAGQQSRAIKAFSAEETEQYLAGAGMSHALAAELNRYPGPMHVLELADRLSLSPQQRAATEQLMQTGRKRGQQGRKSWRPSGRLTGSSQRPR